MAKAPKAKLEDYRPPGYWRRFWDGNAEFTREEMEQGYVEFLLGKLEDERDLAMRIADEVTTPGTTIRYILARAAEEASTAAREYLECDLSTQAGVDRARGLQNQALRYRELIEWLEEAIAKGSDAALELGEIQQAQQEDPSSDVNGEQNPDVGDLNGIRSVQPGP